VSVEEIIDRCAQAIGGSGHLETLKTLRFEYRSQGRDRPLKWEIIRVTLPMGSVAAYAIDAESFLPVRVDLPGWDYRQRLGDFREVGGIFYPHRFWDASGPEKVMVLEQLAVNFELDHSRFVLPADIR
jgi:hypothetical protein